jgi:hypothetical protein
MIDSCSAPPALEPLFQSTECAPDRLLSWALVQAKLLVAETKADAEESRANLLQDNERQAKEKLVRGWRESDHVPHTGDTTIRLVAMLMH